MMKELIAGDPSLIVRRFKIVCPVGEFMTEHSTSACKAISEVTSISHIQYFPWKKQLNLLQNAKNQQA